MVLQSIKMAWKAIAGNKMRSFLTMLGIIVGVLSLVVLVSLVTSATDSVTDSVNSLGTDLITVTITDDGGAPLRLGDMEDFAADDAIGTVAPMGQVSATAKYGYESGSVTVYGTTGDYYDIAGLTLAAGRFLKNTDVENNTQVAIISNDTAEELFGTANPVGESFSLDGYSYLVVGVLEEQESMTSMFSSGYTVYIPYTSAIRLSDTLSSNVTSLYVSAATEDLDATEAAVGAQLLSRFKQSEDAYTLVNQSSMADAMDSITSVLTYLLGGIAAISLLVGGIGIMNIMLVSVTERTKEIGIRKAIGAGRWSILLQFLIEALVICLIGCAIGVILSWAILQIISLIAGDLLSFSLSAGVVGVAVGFSVFIGLVFGLYPASQAAKKRPIDALRFDG